VTSMRRNSAWMLASRASRSLVAALYFTLLARSLGVTGYGAFSSVCAMAGILAPFAGLGTGNLLIQEVARNRQAFADRWGHCLAVTLASGVLLTCGALVLSRYLLPKSIPVTLVLLIAIADLIFVRLLDAAAMAFQSLEQLHMTAWFSFALTFCRMVAATLLLEVNHSTPRQWSLFYLLSTALPALVALGCVTRWIGPPRWSQSSGPDLLLGIYFSISQSAQTIYNDIDKTMLARIVSLWAAGVYGAAYRIVDAAFSPVNAAMAAAYARFFQTGARGVRHAAAFGRRMGLRAVLFSFVASAALWIAAPFVPRVIGGQFAECSIALRLLSPLLVLRSAHVFAADTLTGAGFQGTRTAIQVGVALLNIALNLLVLPRYGWRGAVGTTLACDGALALLLWATVATLCARERRGEQTMLQDVVVQA